MSEDSKQAGRMSKKVLLGELKDRSLFFAWIFGLIILGSLAWVLSRPLLNSFLMRSVNKSMAINQIDILLTPATAVPMSKHAPLGIWYSIDKSPDSFFVFTIFKDGILCVCGARLSPENKVIEIIPISAHANQVFSRIPPGILAMNVQRIENIKVQWSKNE